jgi:cytochrome c oxidase subunit 1
MTTTQAPTTTDATAVQRTFSKWQLYLGFVGLAIGLLMGIAQAMDRLDVNLYDALQLESYYQGLTLHGVSLAIVFTFTFANGFVTLTTMKGFDRPMASTLLVQASFWMAATGVVLAAGAMLMNKATVLYTMYTPMQATSVFYIGAVLLVLSTWATLANQILTLRAWRADNPGEKTPLLAFVSIMTFLMWGIASLGIAIEMLVFVIPWSLNGTGIGIGAWHWFTITVGTDPLLNRTLFWFTAHPIVYFWLLPAYISWYMMIPKQVGGKLFSDGVVRGVFILFLLLSTPVGLHHQFTDPGIDEGLKFIHMAFTFGVFFPSLVTAFTVIAAMENGGRANGGTGILGWILKLPWKNPSFVAQVLAMVAFALGGASGLVNASGTVNQVVHNTSFIPGHFHLTVGTASALSFMGISYWLIPHLTGKPLPNPKTALWQAWLWFSGVLLFSRGQMGAGLEGQPRRLPTSLASYSDSGWDAYNIMAGIGGTIMFISGVLFFWVLFRTLSNRVTGDVPDMPVAETIHGKDETPGILDRIGLWTVVAVVLILIAYVPVFLLHNYEFTSPGFLLF